jgi:hypothetical protein
VIPAGRRRSLVAALLALLVLGSIGVAAAYWRGSGPGTGSATTGTTQPVTLSAGTASAQIRPGGTADVVLTASNPNHGPVRVESLSLDTSQGTGGFAVDGAHAACGVASVSFTTQTNGGAGWDIPGNGASAVTLSNSLAMAANAANTCQGARFTVFLKAGS